MGIKFNQDKFKALLLAFGIGLITNGLVAYGVSNASWGWALSAMVLGTILAAIGSEFIEVS